jgi:hypothetical protein
MNLLITGYMGLKHTIVHKRGHALRRKARAKNYSSKKRFVRRDGSAAKNTQKRKIDAARIEFWSRIRALPPMGIPSVKRLD